MAPGLADILRDSITLETQHGSVIIRCIARHSWDQIENERLEPVREIFQNVLLRMKGESSFGTRFPVESTRVIVL